MPELPEVETVVRDISPKTAGRRIARVVHASPLMARSSCGEFGTALRRQTVVRIDRHGKWMFFRLSGGNTLVVHLGMTGHLHVVPRGQPVEPHTHLRLALDDGLEELRFIDPRRFGELWLCDPAALAEAFGAHRLGPEALRIRRGELAAAVTRSQRRLKALLLDQRAIAGIGNIYADEILFAARLHPARRAAALTEDEIDRLLRSVRGVLRRAIRWQGTTIRDYVTGNGVPGRFQQRLMVYGRADLPCKKCSTTIELDRTIVKGRASHWCPHCQPLRG